MSNNPSKAKHKLFGHDEALTSTTVPKKSKFEKPTFSSTNSASKDGDKTANDVVDHDGVELSVNGSDDEFAAEEGATETDAAEPGELQSSGEESSPVRRVPSKVVKVSRAKPTNNTSLAGGAHKKHAKFDHLWNDPDFKDFLHEMVNDTISAKKSDNKSI